MRAVPAIAVRRHDGRYRRIVRRVLALLATAALLGVGVAIAVMVAGRRGSGGEDEVATPGTATAAKPAARTTTPRRRVLTAKARAARRADVAQVIAQGYTPVTLSTWRPDRALRVLVAAPTGNPTAGQRAFFFGRGGVALGTNTPDDSARIRVARQRRSTVVTLRYRLYGPGDAACCPLGAWVPVRYRWDGGAGVQRIDPLPSPLERSARR